VTLNITAEDAAGLTYSESFTVTVNNVNEAPTDLTLDNNSVDENTAGAVVGNVTVTDPDVGDTHMFSVDDARFEVVGNQLKLVAGASLDAETEPTVTLNITAEDAGQLSYSESFTVTVNNLNEAPTGLALSNASVSENAAGAVVGNVTVTDPDVGDTHTLSVDDARFEVVGNQLKLVAGASLDADTEPTVTLNITAEDTSGLTYSESFTLNVTNVNEAPTDLTLSNTSVAENAAGAVVGVLAVVDPDPGDSHTFTVDDARFEVVGNQLKLVAGTSLDAETEPTVAVNSTVTDGGGLQYSEAFTITVIDINEAPTQLTLDNSSVDENAAGAVIGNLGVSDPDAGDSHTFAVDDVRFEVIGNQLKLVDGISLDAETEPTVTLNITATDSGGLDYSQAFAITVNNLDEGSVDTRQWGSTGNSGAAYLPAFPAYPDADRGIAGDDGFYFISQTLRDNRATNVHSLSADILQPVSMPVLLARLLRESPIDTSLQVESGTDTAVVQGATPGEGAGAPGDEAAPADQQAGFTRSLDSQATQFDSEQAVILDILSKAADGLNCL
jgi:hypothetical protein